MEYIRIQYVPRREQHNHYKDQLVNLIYENNRCLLWESYETHKNTAEYTLLRDVKNGDTIWLCFGGSYVSPLKLIPT
jgi:hypothetical protein